MYNWVTLLYSRNEHNIVNQLYFNKKNFLKEMSALCLNFLINSRKPVIG